jgi:hypothetical protein
MTSPFVDEVMSDEEARVMAGLSNDGLTPNEEMAPNPPQRPVDDARETLQKALYGSDFPGADPDAATDPAAWASWVRGQWESRREAVALHLHLVERNRLFRSGQQWISANGLGPWREPARPRDTARVVYNMVDKALDQRLQIITDQRPGFQVTPVTQDPDDKRKAQAQQLAAEYQYDQQQMDKLRREAIFWAQTDGVSFWHQFWDPERGPWDERMGDGGKPLGDIGCQVLRVEQVRVSPNATASVMPNWVCIREVIPKAEAAFRYGVTGAEASDSLMNNGEAPSYAGSEGLGAWVLSYTTIGEGQRMRDEDVTERFTMYVAPHPDALPEGLHLVVVGDTVVFGPAPLMWSTIPVIAVRDGSSDPSYYPRPVMEQWLDHQMRVNALVSKWVENIRVNAGGRFLTRPNAIATETFLGGVTSMIEIRGAGPMAESIQPVNGFSVGNDVKELLTLEIKAFEDASGWNAVSRGQVTGESGRAIIASREQLERIFAPNIGALAMAFTEWAKVAMAGMKWGYDVPRQLGAVGKNRPDLARAITTTDFDGQSDIRVEPATLMPMPYAFRLYLLDNWLERGVIDQKEYRRRQLFAVARELSSPDEDQEARAKRVADAIRMNLQVPEMRWQDNESIHQDVLEREILLQDDLSPEVIAAAQDRWMQLANQAMQKQGGMPQEAAPQPEMAPMGGSPTGGSPPEGGSSFPAPQLPLASGNPPIGAAPSMLDAMASGDAGFASATDTLSRQF